MRSSVHAALRILPANVIQSTTLSQFPYVIISQQLPLVRASQHVLASTRLYLIVHALDLRPSYLVAATLIAYSRVVITIIPDLSSLAVLPSASGSNPS